MAHSLDSLNDRTKSFAVQTIRFLRKLDGEPAVRWLGRQLFDASTSVAANQRAARRSRSDRELMAKLSIVVEEADESVLWFEILDELDLRDALRIEFRPLLKEATELRNIFSTARATVRRRLQQRKADSC